jgi:flagellar hook-associated protein 3 FlgL
MRVGDSIKFEIFKSNLNRLKSNLDSVQEMMASQKKIFRPSDDAIGFSRGVEIEADRGLISQYKRNLDRLKTLGAMYDSSVTTVHDLLTRAKEIAVTQSSDTMDASTRKSSAEEIKGIIEHLITIGNTKIGNNYVFGGKKSDITPFVLDSGDYSVTFQGSREVPSVFIDKGELEKMGISGYDIFYGSGGFSIFGTLKDLKEALETNNAGAIRNSLDTINTALDLTENNVAYVGTYTGKIDTLVDSQATKDLRYTELMSELMDADMAQLVSDFNMLTNAYQTSLYSMSKLQEFNILNYLR